MTNTVARQLSYLLARRRSTAEAYLLRVAQRHKALGYGSLAAGKSKFSRWKAGTIPELPTQLAIADLEGVAHEEVLRLGWPGWLTLAVADQDDRLYFDSPWTTTGTVNALEKVGAQVDDRNRRDFLVTSTTALSAVIAGWASAPPAQAALAGRGRRVNAAVPRAFQQRLAVLRRLDDQVGSGQVYTSAVSELRMITSVIKECTYTEDVGRQLYAAAAEASRSAGWTAYDSGHHAQAERHFATALRAAASGDDPVVGVNTLAFWAIQHYSTGNPRGAVALVEAAQAKVPAIGSARMTAMLHARACRAYAHAGDHRSADRQANAALDAYANVGPVHDDPDCVYWLNLGEVYQLLGSSSLNLNRPRQALTHFDAATAACTSEAYDGESFPRGAAIYLARRADAHLALHDLEGAVATAHQAVEHMGGVTSARGSSTLSDLRTKLAAHRSVPAISDFLAYTAATSN
ncbi:transcriptional regulator [Kitasatospora sp. RB6PN24]|uniref:transcriptional regulator n=1 Tax=Kitasatospora humi TaxID=2893891 RepID=UPI001E35D035|nr:transcriptional regulator [Kitasatospora humi]MCC9310059.1 transcriptional regulator [Kitasatospora humi]